MSLEIHDVFSQAVPGAFGTDFLHKLLSMTSPSTHTPDDDKTPGRDALALAFYDPVWPEMSQAKMQVMPDEWQGRMAALINEFAVAQTTSTPQ